jgi:hypothetical protein
MKPPSAPGKSCSAGDRDYIPSLLYGTKQEQKSAIPCWAGEKRAVRHHLAKPGGLH